MCSKNYGIHHVEMGTYQIQTWNLWIPLICENSMLLSNKALAMMSRTLCHCAKDKLGQIQTWYCQSKYCRVQLVYSYRGEDETLGPGVGDLNLLQSSHNRLHFGRVASLKSTGRGKLLWISSHLFLHYMTTVLLTDLDRYVLVLTGRLGGENIGNFCVGCSLPTDGALDGTPPWAHAILLHDNSDALITEAVAACQHSPLKKERTRDCAAWKNLLWITLRVWITVFVRLFH